MELAPIGANIPKANHSGTANRTAFSCVSRLQHRLAVDDLTIAMVGRFWLWCLSRLSRSKPRRLMGGFDCNCHVAYANCSDEATVAVRRCVHEKCCRLGRKPIRAGSSE